ncbi:ribosome assembly cofactor RimP [Bizionia argentinensis JUB59]|uniref:Ribosome maturation factor RimP n=1 Tax=Bizionia argentinensis JUB59 TaxID=1046627 RepID=G2EG01_9FLAO|nr:ribosome assembly cofactor RimP [Bizionia argentinensis]EGV42636.1 ribosome assembly cofactor RimP [Bizionia argentinensis JUB59]
MLRKIIETLLNDALEEREDLFLIDFSMGADNAISVIIDGDEGITVDDCVFISRAIENNIDREEHDFSLEVASGGASAPLVHERQYKKHIGRDLEIRTKQEQVSGQLTEATDTYITLQWKAREPKPIGKGKVTVQKEAKIAYQDIVEAKVMIKF